MHAQIITPVLPASTNARAAAGRAPKAPSHAAGPRARMTRLLLWAVVVLACLVSLAVLAASGAHVDQANHLGAICCASGLLMACLSAMAWLLITTPEKAIKLPKYASALFILLVAVATRLAVFYTWTPSLSDDIFRYRHDGRMVLAGYEPYAYLPTDHPPPHNPAIHVNYVKKSPLPFDLLDRMSNNGFVPTLYLPVSLYVLAGAAFWEEHVLGAGLYKPGTLAPPEGTAARRKLVVKLAAIPAMQPYRFVHVLADIATVVVLLGTLLAIGRSPWWAALYAWHPLPLIEIAGNGHLESVGVALLMGAIWALLARRWKTASVLMALALMVKPWAIFVLPAAVAWYLRRRETPAAEHPKSGTASAAKGGGPSPMTSPDTVPAIPLTGAGFYASRSGGLSNLPTATSRFYEPPGASAQARTAWQDLKKLAGIYVLTVALCLLPFITGLPALWHTMSIYAQNWYFNGFFYSLLRYLVFWGNGYWPRLPLNFLYPLIVLWLAWVAWKRDWPLGRTLGHVLLLYMLFTPQVYPWYVLWPLALLPLAWNAGTWVLAYTVLFSYEVLGVFQATGVWRVHWWVLLVEWVPVAVLEVWQLRRDLCEPFPKEAPRAVAAPGAAPSSTVTMVGGTPMALQT